MKRMLKRRIWPVAAACLLILLGAANPALAQYPVSGQNGTDGVDRRPPPPARIESKRVQFGPASSDSYLVWHERDVALRPEEDIYASLNGSYDIMAQDLKSNQVFEVASGPNKQVDAVIDGSIVAWDDNAHSGPASERDVKAKDLATGINFDVASGPADQVYPSISGRTVAWLEVDAKSSRVRFKDLDAETIQDVVEVPRTSDVLLLQPRISADYIVWAEVGATDDKTRSIPVELRSYKRQGGSVSTVARFRLSDSTLPEYDLEDALLVWVEDGLRLANLQGGGIVNLYIGGRVAAPKIQNKVVLWNMNSGTPISCRDIWGLKLGDRQALPLISGSDCYGRVSLAGDTLIWAGESGAAAGKLSRSSLSSAFAAAPGRLKEMQEQRKSETSKAGRTGATGVTYTNVLTKGIHAANSTYGWNNSDGGYLRPCKDSANTPPCPAVDVLGADYGTPYFGSVMVLQGDLEAFTTGRPSPWGPYVKHAMQRYVQLGKFVTVRTTPSFGPQPYSTADLPEQVAQQVVRTDSGGLAWRSWMRGIQIHNEPNNDREWPARCTDCSWAGAPRAPYTWTDYYDAQFLHAVNDFYSGVWWKLDWYRQYHPDASTRYNLNNNIGLWTPAMAPIGRRVNGTGEPVYQLLEPMVLLYGSSPRGGFSYHLYPAPNTDGLWGGLRNYQWGEFTNTMRARMEPGTGSPTLRSQVTEFGWNPYEMDKCGYVLNSIWQVTHWSNSACNALDGHTHYFENDSVYFLQRSERHNASAIYPYLVRGGNASHDGITASGIVRAWLYYYQQSAP